MNHTLMKIGIFTIQKFLLLIVNSISKRLFNDSNIFKHHLLTMERKAHLTKLTQRAEHLFQNLISVKNTIKCTKHHYSLYTT